MGAEEEEGRLAAFTPLDAIKQGREFREAVTSQRPVNGPEVGRIS
jgi:hypothetical protein